jgi:hypothetical protein
MKGKKMGLGLLKIDIKSAEESKIKEESKMDLERPQKASDLYVFSKVTDSIFISGNSLNIQTLNQLATWSS